MKKVIVMVIIGLLLGYSSHAYLHYRKLHPVRMFYFMPVHLTKDIPILKKIDRFFEVSAGIDWYKVKNKKTGREYLMKINYWYDGKNFLQRYFVIDNIKRDKWIEFSQEQFQKTFGNASEGEALQELPNTNIKTYSKP